MSEEPAIPMLLICPACGKRHIDEGEFATKLHHTHACQHCGTVWRPAIVPTVGVQFLPGYGPALTEASICTPEERALLIELEIAARFGRVSITNSDVTPAFAGAFSRWLAASLSRTAKP